jgi:hypothetical protein
VASRDVIVGVRPEDIERVGAGTDGRGLRFDARVDTVESTGADLYAHTRIDGGLANAEPTRPSGLSARWRLRRLLRTRGSIVVIGRDGKGGRAYSSGRITHQCGMAGTASGHPRSDGVREQEGNDMALDDYFESEVAVAVAATAAALSPGFRRVLRRGAVYGVAGVLKATDIATAAARGVARGASGDGDAVRTGDGRGDTGSATSGTSAT